MVRTAPACRGISRRISASSSQHPPAFQRGLEFRFDIINLLDQVYQIRIGQGFGVFAPQLRPRRRFSPGWRSVS